MGTRPSSSTLRHKESRKKTITPRCPNLNWGCCSADNLICTPVFPKEEREIKNPSDVMEHAEKCLLRLSMRRASVEEMTLLYDTRAQRKLCQWVNGAVDLEREVFGVIEEQKNSKDPLLNCEELKNGCHRIFKYLNSCPVAFRDQMHETEDTHLQGEDDLKAQVDVASFYSSDMSVLKSGNREGSEGDDTTIFTRNESESERVPFPDSAGAPVTKLTSELENKLVGESNESCGELKISLEGSSSPSILHDEYVQKPEIIEEGAAPQGILEEVEQEYASQRRREKMPVGVYNPNDVSSYSNEAMSHHEFLDKNEMNLSKLSIEMSSSCSEEKKRNSECVIEPTQTDESELGTINIPISANGEKWTYVKLELGILSSSPSQEAFSSLNSYFGLDPEKENYSFFNEPGDHQFELDGQMIDIVDGDWHEARVAKLMEKNEVSLNEMKEQDCPNLALLFLQRNNWLTRLPRSFFDQMPALSFLDLSNTRIKKLPTSLYDRTKLQVLLLRSCICLKRLTNEVEKLKRLEVLDVLGSDLYEIPKELGELTQLKQLHLSFYCPDYGNGNDGVPSELIPPGAKFKQKDLQALSIVVHPEDQRWKRIVSNIIQQIRKFKKLSYLQFYFPTVEDLKSFIEESPSWKENRLKRFKFIVGNDMKRIISRVPDAVESDYNQHDRCLRFVNGSEQVSQVMKRILEPVTAFYLDHHFEVQSLSDFIISNFKELRFCVVRECPNIKVVIMGEKSSQSAFPNLKYLGLHYLWELDTIWEDPLPRGSFNALKYLMVSTCGKLEYIASHTVLQSLANLEEFIIEDCENLKSIVRKSEIVKYDDHAVPLLPRLKKLQLCHLPQLVALGSGLFPSKEIISIHFCPKLKILYQSPLLEKFFWLNCISAT